MNIDRKKLLPIITSLIIMFSMGCAIKRGVVNTTPPLYNKSHNKIEQTLLNKVAKYWQYRKSNMPEKSFEYEYRSIKGAKLDKIYRNYVHHLSRAKVKKIEITKVKEYDEGKCLVLKFFLKEKNRLGEDTFFQEDCWIKKGENYYHILGNKLIFNY